MPRFLSAVFAAFVAFASVLRAAAPPTRTPLVALAPASLHQTDKGFGPPVTEATPLAELVQLTLQADPAFAPPRFIECTTLDVLLHGSRALFRSAAWMRARSRPHTRCLYV